MVVFVAALFELGNRTPSCMADDDRSTGWKGIARIANLSQRNQSRTDGTAVEFKNGGVDRISITLPNPSNPSLSVLTL